MAAKKHTTLPAQLDLSFTPAEEWRDIPGYESLYQVSNLGRVRSLARRVPATKYPNKWRISPGKVLRPKGSPSTWYFDVSLSKDGQKRTWFVHHLVLMTFVGPRPPGMVCNHLDSDPKNNAVTNLEWCTQFQNRHHSMDKGRWHPFLLRGEEASWAKFTEAQVRDIRARVAQGISMASLAREFQVRHGTIAKIVYRERWKHVP